MSKLHYNVPTGPIAETATVRLGASGSATNFLRADEGKLVKLAATDQYDLCVAGDLIEGVVLSTATATSGGFSVGAITAEGRIYATADGLQATPGTGTLAVGDYVVAGTITALHTALTAYPKVCKATVQPGDVPANLTAAAAQVRASMYAWRVVSLFSAGTGAVGTTVVIERVNC